MTIKTAKVLGLAIPTSVLLRAWFKLAETNRGR